MTTFRNRLLAVAALALLIGADHAMAASQVMCAPEATSGGQGRPVTNPTTNNAYSLNGQGCAIMRNDDAAYFAAQGFSQGQNNNSLVFTQQTSGFNFTMPLSSYIRNIAVHEGTGNSTGSGICFSSTAGGGTSDVATVVGTGSLLRVIPDTSIGKRILSTTAAQQVFVNSCAGTGFGTSIWDFTIELAYF